MKILPAVIFISCSLLTFTELTFADHADHHHLVEGKENLITIPELKAGVVDPDGELITVAVHGLVCDFCAVALEKVFMRREAVSGIDVNLTKGRVIVSLKSGEEMTDALLTELITNAGYSIEQITR